MGECTEGPQQQQGQNNQAPQGAEKQGQQPQQQRVSLRGQSYANGRRLLQVGDVGDVIGDGPPPYEWRPDQDPDIVWVPDQNAAAAARVARDAYGAPDLASALEPITRGDRVGYRLKPQLLSPDWQATYLTYRPAAQREGEVMVLDPRVLSAQVAPTRVVLYDPTLANRDRNPLTVLPSTGEQERAQWDVPLFQPTLALQNQPAVPQDHATQAPVDPRQMGFRGDPVQLERIIADPGAFAELLNRPSETEVLVKFDAHGAMGHLGSSRMTFQRDRGNETTRPLVPEMQLAQPGSRQLFLGGTSLDIERDRPRQDSNPRGLAWDAESRTFNFTEPTHTRMNLEWLQSLLQTQQIRPSDGTPRLVVPQLTSGPIVVVDPSGDGGVFQANGMTVLSGPNAALAQLSGGRIEVYLWDGRSRLIQSDTGTMAALMARSMQRQTRNGGLGLQRFDRGLGSGRLGGGRLGGGGGADQWRWQPGQNAEDFFRLNENPGDAFLRGGFPYGFMNQPPRPAADSFRMLTVGQLNNLARRTQAQDLLRNAGVSASRKGQLADLTSNAQYVPGTSRDGRNTVDTGSHETVALDPLADAAPQSTDDLATIQGKFVQADGVIGGLQRAQSLSRYRDLIGALRVRVRQHKAALTAENSAQFQQLVDGLLAMAPTSRDRITEVRALDQRFGRSTADGLSVEQRLELISVHNQINDPGHAFEELEGKYALSIIYSDQTATALGFFSEAERTMMQYRQVVANAKPGNFQQQLDGLQGALASERHRAHEAGIINDATYNAWNALSRDMIVLQAQRQGGSVSSGVRASAARHAQSLFEALDKVTPMSALPSGGYGGSSTMVNEYTGEMTTVAAFYSNTSGAGPELAGDIRDGNWTKALKNYSRLVGGLDKWIAHELEEKHGENSKEAQRANYLGAMRGEMQKIEEHNPKRVSAVFQADEATYGKDARLGVPLQLYYWEQDGEWILKDLTNPNRTFEDNVSKSSGQTEPPHSLFQELDTKLHFPKGLISYQLPNGGRMSEVTTTESMTWVDWLTYIGLGLAAVGLGLVTFGTGTVAVLGTVALAAGSVASATAAAGDMYQRADHGALDGTTAILDIATIVGSLATAGALGAGRITVAGVQAARGGTALTGTMARLAAFSGRAYVPLVGTAIAADGVGLITMTSQAVAQIQQIKDSNLPEGQKNRSIALLIAQIAATGGLMMLSVKGDLPALRGQNANVVLDIVDGVPTARLAGTGPTRVGQAQDVAGAFEDSRVATTRGQIGADDAARVMGDLPTVRIDPTNESGSIARYLADDLGVSAADLQISRLGGNAAGFSGAVVYKAMHKGELMGFFKVFGDRAEFLREVGALNKLRGLQMEHFRGVEIGNPGRFGDTGVGLMEAAPGRILKSTLEDVGGMPAGAARTEAVEALVADVRSVARGMSELHSAGSAGRSVAPEYIEKEITKLLGRWDGLADSIPAADRVRLRRAMEGLFEDFRGADLPATLAHGDGHAGNFSVHGDQVTTFDVETLWRSVGQDGKGVATGAADTGRFNESLRLFGQSSGLSASEIDLLQTTFTREYRSAAGATGSSADFQTASRFYEINLTSIALRTEIQTAGAAFDAASSPAMTRLRALLGL